MKHFKITIKEKGHERPVCPEYVGNVTEAYLIDFFGLERNDVESYTIEDITGRDAQ